MSTTDSTASSNPDSGHQHKLTQADNRFQAQALRLTAIEQEQAAINARLKALEAPAPVVTPPPFVPSGYTFFDDFSSTALNPAMWGHHYKCPGSVQSDSLLAYVKDGSLHIPAVLRNGQWYGDLVDTRDSFQQTYGLFEASIRIVPGDTKAAWPAFWLYAGVYGQDGDEIDVVELLGKDGAAGTWAAHQTVHKGTMANQVYAPWAAITAFGSPLVDHVYAVDWRADHIAFLIDGKETWRETSLLISTPKAILLNHGIGGWGGVPASATNGGETIVNWVRASK